MPARQNEEERLYGPTGFSETPDLRALLAPYEPADDRDDEITDFSGLTPRDAEQLLRLLPELHNRNRQNAAPSFEEFIELAQEYPAIRFHGYRIHACRFDERITIEGYYYPVGRQAEALYQRVQQIASAPDEYGRFDCDGETVMRAWWD